MKPSTIALALCLLGVSCGDDGEAAQGSSGGTTRGSSGGTASTTTETSSETASETAGSTRGEATDEDSGSTGGGFVEVDCTEPCSDLASDAGVAVCYACRCKNAMDGFLPSVEQLQCSEADELTVYTADISGPEPELVPRTQDSGTCANPALLTETCGQGSRLGQLQAGDIFVKWVCRDPDPNGVYADMGAIMYNARTGASCWFDDIDAVTTDDNVPDLDLMNAGEDNLTGFVERFYFTDGESCTTDCHAADPFIYTPFFEGVQWHTGPFALGPHVRVELDATLSPIDATHLTSRDAAPCTSCHRIGSSAGCDFLSPDAMGDDKTAAHEQAIHDATDAASPNWSLAYWMPGDVVFESLEEWMDTYGAAKARIRDCCANPGVNSAGCTWEPIPSV